MVTFDAILGYFTQFSPGSQQNMIAFSGPAFNGNRVDREDVCWCLERKVFTSVVKV